MKFVIKIPNYMLRDLLAMQDPKNPMSVDDTIHMCIAKAAEDANDKRTDSKDGGAQ